MSKQFILFFREKATMINLQVKKGEFIGIIGETLR